MLTRRHDELFHSNNHRRYPKFESHTGYESHTQHITYCNHRDNANEFLRHSLHATHKSLQTEIKSHPPILVFILPNSFSKPLETEKMPGPVSDTVTQVNLKHHVPEGPVTEDAFDIIQISPPKADDLQDGDVLLKLVYVSVE